MMDNINDKYKDIVEKGKELFWKFGIKKVTVEEISSAAGTSRVTFYKYFSNKEELALHILKEISEEALAEYRTIMDSDAKFEEKVEKTILMKMKSTGSISHELLNDVYSGDFPKISEYLHKVSVESFSMVEEDYRKAQEQGFLRKDLKIEFVMYMLNKMQEMASDPALERHYKDSGEMVTELINYFFYGILPRNHS
jgi:AcrR family transcriptional regulator